VVCKKNARFVDLMSRSFEPPEKRMPDWQELMNRNGRSVWQTAYRLLGNRDDADECFQETFLAALEVSRREEVKHWGALLRRLAAVRAVDRLRQRYRRRAGAQVADWDALPGPARMPSEVAEDAELGDRLRAALACLPPKQAEAFCLHHLEDWSYQETASHLAITVDSVGVLLHRARHRLRQLLELPADEPPAASHSPVPNRESTILPEEST
jgi:RNA polymerase sigma-70 factor, ECF subfamily